MTTLCAEERALGYLTPEAYAPFDARVQQHRAEVSGAIENLRQTGAKLAGYGASVGSLTLLHAYGLSQRIDTIFDDSPLQPTLSAGDSEIRIRLSDEIYAGERPDASYQSRNPGGAMRSGPLWRHGN